MYYFYKHSFITDPANQNALPQWIVQVYVKDDKFKNVFFNCSKFDIKQYAGSAFQEWYDKELNNIDWTSFNARISDLANACVKQLEIYYSTKRKPKNTRLMHSTERHHLAALAATQFPQLVLKYSEYQRLFYQGDGIGVPVYETTLDRSTFMVLCFLI